MDFVIAQFFCVKCALLNSCLKYRPYVIFLIRPSRPFCIEFARARRKTENRPRDLGEMAHQVQTGR